MHTTRLNLLATAFLVLFANQAFFRNVAAAYPDTLYTLAFTASLGILLAGFIMLLLTLLTWQPVTRALLAVILLLASVTAYFMDSYNVVIDTGMLRNVVQTDVRESLDLFDYRLLVYVLLLGVLPALFVLRVPIQPRPFRHELFAKLKVVTVIVVVITAQLLLFSKAYASFFREHKPLRYYSNPLTSLWSGGKYLAESVPTGPLIVEALGMDAVTPPGDKHRELVIFVLGETARADHFSLNGYARETNPLLAKENVISLTDMQACGTSTAVSVPCIFSRLGRSDYSDDKARHSENLLDVLAHAGVQVLWRDNNSSSKGVADRVTYQDFRTSGNNTVCDDECRDEGMLVGLQDYIDGTGSGDIFIVLHQMGNHGPAYYKRYPAEFEKFTPVCRTSQLEDCSSEEISNAYDNAILYTDYFLSKVIALLRQNDDRFETTMMYISDHGESLGEHGVYLHGLPWIMAPDAQKDVGALLWLDSDFDAALAGALQANSARSWSHDNIFHTVLGLLEIDTAIYDRELDITRPTQARELSLD
ncbi:MAG: phosphoethanolamine--lipid A transferase [Gammaproteobacteria bacterium]